MTTETIIVWRDSITGHVQGVKGAFLVGPHDQKLDAVEYVRAPSVPAQRVLHDFAAKLRELDDRNVSTRGNALAHEDPRDLVKRIESMCAGLRMLGRTPGVEHARALGAHALALCLACARVEELDITSGDAAA